MSSAHMDNYKGKPVTPVYEMIGEDDIQTVEEARGFAMNWQQWASNQSLSYEELAAYQYFFSLLVNKFPVLREEFEENGII